MCPHALIPYKPANSKTRLSCLFSQDERETLARAMLDDVVDAVKDANCTPVIVATDLFDSDLVQVTITDADLNQSLNTILPRRLGQP